MITIKHVKTLDGQTTHLQIASAKDYTLDADNRLLLLPGLIDSHISLGASNKDEWASAVKDLVRGGITTVLDIPSQDSPSNSKQDLEHKRHLIDERLSQLNIPLHYFLYHQGNSEFVEEMGLAKSLMIGSLLLLSHDYVLDEPSWDRIFQIAAWENIPLVINSRNENAWKEAPFKKTDETLLEKAIYYAEKHNAVLYVLNVATQNEVDLIIQANDRSLLIYAETTVQHLFPSNASQSDFLWNAINSGVIDIIGSGYHIKEQNQDRLITNGKNFDFLNPIFILPMLLSAYHEGKTTLETIVRLTRVNLYDIFRLERKDQDAVLVNLEEEQVVQRVNKTHSSEMKLKGWPVYTIVNGQIYNFSQSGNDFIHVE
jgi:dihydroorotase